jgi:hypothetical protein
MIKYIAKKVNIKHEYGLFTNDQNYQISVTQKFDLIDRTTEYQHIIHLHIGNL